MHVPHIKVSITYQRCCEHHWLCCTKNKDQILGKSILNHWTVWLELSKLPTSTDCTETNAIWNHTKNKRLALVCLNLFVTFCFTFDAGLTLTRSDWSNKPAYPFLNVVQWQIINSNIVRITLQQKLYTFCHLQNNRKKTKILHLSMPTFSYGE